MRSAEVGWGWFGGVGLVGLCWGVDGVCLGWVLPFVFLVRLAVEIVNLFLARDFDVDVDRDGDGMMKWGCRDDDKPSRA